MAGPQFTIYRDLLTSIANSLIAIAAKPGTGGGPAGPDYTKQLDRIAAADEHMAKGLDDDGSMKAATKVLYDQLVGLGIVTPGQRQVITG